MSDDGSGSSFRVGQTLVWRLKVGAFFEAARHSPELQTPASTSRLAVLLPFRVIGRSTVTGLSQSPTSVTPGTGTLTCCAAFKLNGLYARKPKKHFRPQRPLLGDGARSWKAGASSLQLSLVLLVCLESAGGRRAWAALLCSSVQSEATQRASRCHRALLDRQALRAATCHGRLRLQVCRRHGRSKDQLYQFAADRLQFAWRPRGPPWSHGLSVLCGRRT
jgi:hypothetical protein